MIAKTMMKTLLGGAFLLGAFTLAPEAEAQKKDKKNTPVGATPEEYAQIRNARELVGKIAFADESTRMISLRIDVPQMQANQPNKNAKRGKGNPFRPNYKVVNVGKNFDLPVDDKATVRRLFVAIEYDDKGFLKNNAQEQGVLKSKGYIPAKYEDIKTGMTARLHLSPPKAGAKGDEARPLVKTILLVQPPNNSTPNKK